MKAIIFNSGLGKRMGVLTKDHPKCMVKLYNGETIFERQIRILSECGINEFIITTGSFKEQIINASKKFATFKFEFVDNPDYASTNYIVSMNNASEYLDDDILLLHGDLVFNKSLIKKILSDKRKSICLFNEDKELPEKDFKGRFSNNMLKEVSISIFDKDCYAFQPLYKLSKKDIELWKNTVKNFVDCGNDKVYAENALNEITDSVLINGMSYKDDYIDEIDNEEDYIRVSNEIKFFDYREQDIIIDSYINYIKTHVDIDNNLFIVCSKRFQTEISTKLEKYNITFFDGFSPNPKYEQIKNGVDLFKENTCKIIISIGGGSSIDVAKCIKLFSSMKEEKDFLEKKYIYNDIKHIAIPTTAGTGSESTQIAVIYYKGNKFSVDHGSILPDVAILDYTLIKTLSDYQKKATLLDSLAQAIESFWAKGATLESKNYSKKCISLIMKSYKSYMNNNESSFEDIMLASNYSGRAINISRTTAAHSMSYKLTSLYGISHGHAVALCLIPIWRLLFEKSNTDDKLYFVLKELSQVFEEASKGKEEQNSQVKQDDNIKQIDDNINLVKNIIDGFDLPKIEIKDYDIDVLTKSVDMNRMSNNPVVFTEKEIRSLYRYVMQH